MSVHVQSPAWDVLLDALGGGLTRVARSEDLEEKRPSVLLLCANCFSSLGRLRNSPKVYLVQMVDLVQIGLVRLPQQQGSIQPWPAAASASAPPAPACSTS